MVMWIRLFVLVFVFVTGRAVAQESKVFCEDVRSLQVMVDGDPLAPPVVELGHGHRTPV